MATYIQIGSTVTVGAGGAANISFTSIPSTYTDLVLVASLRDTRGDAAWTDGSLSINGTPSGSAYSFRYLLGDGGAAYSGAPSGRSSITAWLENSALSTANTFNNVQFYFPNYANTSYNKSISIDSAGEANTTTAYSSFVAGLWSSTAAISSLYLTPGVGNWAQYSTASLYGISKS